MCLLPKIAWAELPSRLCAAFDVPVHCRGTMIQWMWWRLEGGPCPAAQCSTSSSWEHLR